MFLKSSHLPAYLVAAFIKRMARLAMFAPTPAILAVLPMIHNLLRQHSECRVLLHREYPSAGGEDNTAATDPPIEINESSSCTAIMDALLRMDPYDAYEADPEKCNAIESSLWELETLQDHYLPQIANFVKGFRKIIDVKQMPFDVEDFLDLSYDKLIDAELDKKLKNPAPLNYQFSKTLFGDNELIMNSWSFE
jgi:U3 small nucleolar RNA-associated protein 19